MRALVAASLAEFLAAETSGFATQLFTDVTPGPCAGIIPTVTDRIGPAQIDCLEGLQIIANFGVGYDNIDVDYARGRGIAVTNTPGVLTDATAELTWALILATTRRIGEGERLVRSGQWTGWTPTQLRGMGLTGKTLGIIGAGRIGTEVARRATAFGMHVLYWNRQPKHGMAGRHAALDDVIRVSDVVSIHLAKSAETQGLIDARTLSSLKDGAVLINTARGSIVDEAALIRELHSGRIRAGLDVYAEEPHIPAELMKLENVTLLPHLGSATYETRAAMWQLAWQNLTAGLTGQPLLTPVR